MKKQTLAVLWLGLGLVCTSMRPVLGGGVWTGGAGGDDRWSATGNWASGSPPANPDTGDIVFNNDDIGNVNGMNQNWTAYRILYVNNSLAAGHTTDLSNQTLVVRNTLWVGRNVCNSSATIRNGTLQMGNATYSPNLYVGYNGSTEADVHQTNNALTITGTLNASNLQSVVVGYSGNTLYDGGGALDLSGATLTSPGGANRLKIKGALSVGKGRYNTYTAYGSLKLPASLQSLEVDGILTCGEGVTHSGPRRWSEGVIDFGTGSSLTNLKVGGDFLLGCRGAVVSELRNFPPSAAVSIGKSGTPAGLYLGYVSVGAYGSANRATVAELHLANRLTAYLHTVVVGESSDGAVVGNSCTGILDIAAADVQIGNQPGKITGVVDLRIGTGNNAYGLVSIPSNITELSVGRFVLGSGGWSLLSGGSSYYGANAWLDITSNSQLKVFTATNGFYMAAEQASGRIGYRDGATWVDYFPTGVTFTVGSPGRYVPMHLLTWTESLYVNPPTTGNLAIVNGSFTGYLTELLVGYSTAYRGRSYGTLDLTGSTVQIGDTPNAVKVPRLIVSGGRNATTGDPYRTGGGHTRLVLPASVTNVTAGELQVGAGGGNYGEPASEGILEFVAGSQLQSLTVTNRFYLGAYHAVSGVIAGLPTHAWTLALGSPNRRIPVLIGHKNNESSYNKATGSTGIFAPTNATVTAYLSSLLLGVCSNTSSYGSTYGVLDLTGATVDTLDVETTIIGYTLHTYSASGKSRGWLKLPAGSTARTGNLLMGYSLNNVDWVQGFLELHGSKLEVANQLTLYPRGYVTNRLAGATGGIYLTSTDTNKFIMASTARMHIAFDADPDDIKRDHYWGLKKNGNQVAYFNTLHGDGRLTWNVGGLSPKFAGRVGIYYDTANDATYLGVPRDWPGTTILLR